MDRTSVPLIEQNGTNTSQNGWNKGINEARIKSGYPVNESHIWI